MKIGWSIVLKIDSISFDEREHSMWIFSSRLFYVDVN